MKPRSLRRIPALVSLTILLCAAAFAAGAPPRVLIVVAHPDDESCMAATTYRIAKELGGTVDQLVITDGEGGFHYSLLANKYYGVNLTDEAVGRKYLPEIRKRELMRAGRVLGVRSHFFLDQPDPGYTQDIKAALAVWDDALVERQIHDVLQRGRYDFVFTLLPTADTHGHHKAATVLALQGVADMPAEARPVVLGCTDTTTAQPQPAAFSGLDGYPQTRPLPQAPLLRFDREVKFGFKNALDYQIVVNWEIAEHKSQGLFETGFSAYRYEDFFVYEPDGAAGLEKTKELFDLLTPKPGEAH